MRLLTTAALMLIARTLAGQSNGVVVARVIDAGSGAPVSGVEVSIEGTRFAERSDSLGVATLAGVPAGEVTLRARHISFAPAVARGRLGAGDTLTIGLLLNPASQTLPKVSVLDSNDVEVNPEFEARRRFHVGGYFITGKEIDKAPTWTIAGLLEQRVPGLHPKVGLDGSILVNATVFLDGTRLTDHDAGIVNLHDLGGIEYYPPNYVPVQYRTPPYKGGVLLLWTRR